MRRIDVDSLAGSSIDPLYVSSSSADGALIVEVGEPVRLDSRGGHGRAGRERDRVVGQLPGGQGVPVGQHQVVMGGPVSGMQMNDKCN